MLTTETAMIDRVLTDFRVKCDVLFKIFFRLFSCVNALKPRFTLKLICLWFTQNVLLEV